MSVLQLAGRKIKKRQFGNVTALRALRERVLDARTRARTPRGLESFARGLWPSAAG